MSDGRPPGIPASESGGIHRSGAPGGDAPASLMGDRYRIERIIGTGAFGRVYLAVDAWLRRNVAIKELLARRATTDDDAYARYLERFEREARAAGVVQHANIVAVLELAIDAGENYYLVMEFIDGTNLRDLLSQVRTLPVERAVRITLEIAQALEAVHEHDIVHRDLKPANIMLTRRGVAKLADFGVAQVGHESQRTQISSGHPGTPLYMSPEQGSGYGYIDGRSDLYSLGLVLYELLTGEPFARRRQPLEILLPGISPDLVTIFARLTAKDVDARYANAGEVVAALASLSSAHSTRPAAETQPLPGNASAAAPNSETGSRATIPPTTPSQGDPSRDVPATVVRQAGSIDRAPGPGTASSQPPPAFLETPAALRPAHSGKVRGRGVLIGVAGAVIALAIIALLLIVTRGQSAIAPPTRPAGPTPASAVAQVQVTPGATVQSPTATPMATPTPATPTSAPAVASASTIDFSQWVTTEVAGAYRRSFDAATGEYHVTLLRDNAVQPILSPDTQRIADLMIEVDVRHVAGPDAGGYGLAFRVQPLGQGDSSHASYLFVIDGQQRYALYELSGDGMTTFIQAFTALPDGTMNVGANATNHLTVTCRGDRITVAVNGKTLNTYTANITQPGTVGITVESPARAIGVETAFKNLRVTPL